MSGKTLVDDCFMTLIPVFVLFIRRGVVVVVIPGAIVVVLSGIIVVVLSGIIVVVLSGIIVVVVSGAIVVVLPDESARVAISPQVCPRGLSIVNELLSSLNVMVNEVTLIGAVNE
jgi:hypothetical protein